MREERLQRVYEPFIQVRFKSIVFYGLPDPPYQHKRAPLLPYSSSLQQTDEKRPYSGQITEGSAKRIRKAVDLLCQIARKRRIFNPVIQEYVWHTLTFITLTISGRERHINTREGHKLLLEPWLLRMRRKAGLKSYIWKAEFQKNGQLHYHITTDCWIHYQLIRDEWNNLLSKNGLLSKFDYSKGKSPNSTDVHAVYKVRDISAYLVKYLAKEDPVKRADSKVWDCSINLKRSKHFSLPLPTNFHIPDTGLRTLIEDYFQIVWVDNPAKYLGKSESQLYKEFLRDLANYTATVQSDNK